MSDLPNVFGTMLADLATRVSNSAVNADPVLQGRLTQLSGNCVEFNCLAPGNLPTQIWHLMINDQQLFLRHGPADAPQVIVTGTAMELASWIFNNGGAAVQIEGDEVLLVTLQEIFKDFRPDFAEPLQRLFGRDAAQSMLGAAELGLGGFRSAIEGFGKAMSGQAAATNVSGEQLDSILRTVDELRLKVDRLSAQLDAQSAASDKANPD